VGHYNNAYVGWFGVLDVPTCLLTSAFIVAFVRALSHSRHRELSPLLDLYGNNIISVLCSFQARQCGSFYRSGTPARMSGVQRRPISVSLQFLIASSVHGREWESPYASGMARGSVSLPSALWRLLGCLPDHPFGQGSFSDGIPLGSPHF